MKEFLEENDVSENVLFTSVFAYTLSRFVGNDKVFFNIIDNGLQKELGIKPLYPLSEAIKSEKYFYDTANHCNTWGKGEYTNNLIKYLKKYIKENNL